MNPQKRLFLAVLIQCLFSEWKGFVSADLPLWLAFCSLVCSFVVIQMALFRELGEINHSNHLRIKTLSN